MADMKEIVIYVHGKGGSAAETGHYRSLFPDAEVVGFVTARRARGRPKPNSRRFSRHSGSAVTASR